MTDRLPGVRRALDPERLRANLLELLNIYSPSGKEEDVQLYLEEVLRAAGLTVHRQEVEEERYNLVATMGRTRPDFFLVGHVDTIPAWDLEMTEPQQEGDLVRGLGSADMKGGCAAMLEAFLALAALPLAERPAAGLLLTVGEEETGDGSSAFLREYRPQSVVIGEPTGLAACFAHYGYLEANLVTRGRRIHSSLPELGHNAVESMLRVLLHLGRAPLFDRGRTEIVYSIREMVSSRAGFVVPDRCETWIDLHLSPEVDPLRVEREMRDLAAGAGRQIADLDLEMNFDFAAPGYNLGLDSRLSRTLAAVYGELNLELRFDTFRSHSDGNLFFQAGVKPLLLGPGELEVAHTPDEQIDFRQVLEAASIYAILCLRQGGE